MFSILKLQPLLETHLKAAVELDQLCLGGIWQLDGYARELASPNSTLISLNLVEPSKQQEQIIGLGCVWAILEEAHITILAVHPAYQGKGLGTLLLTALLEDAVGRNLARATLEVNVNNRTAISLYKKFGFKTAGIRPAYYQKTAEDALILWRKGLQLQEFKLALKDQHTKIKEKLTKHNLALQ